MTWRGGPLLLWLVATAAAIAVASAAITQVGREVTLDIPLDAQLAQTTGAPSAPPAVATPPAPSEPTPIEPAASTPVPPEQVVRTYDVVGGRAAVAVVGGTVEVRWATPREGFRASVERAADGTELRVEFRSDVHRSRIEVAVEGGRIVDAVEEDDRR